MERLYVLWSVSETIYALRQEGTLTSTSLDTCTHIEVLSARFDAVLQKLGLVFDPRVYDRAFGVIGEAIWYVGCFIGWHAWIAC